MANYPNVEYIHENYRCSCGESKYTPVDKLPPKTINGQQKCKKCLFYKIRQITSTHDHPSFKLCNCRHIRIFFLRFFLPSFFGAVITNKIGVISAMTFKNCSIKFPGITPCTCLNHSHEYFCLVHGYRANNNHCEQSRRSILTLQVSVKSKAP